jgi:hypothetical protein
VETSIRDVITGKDAPGGPLFANGGKLADAIASIPKSAYAGRRDSVYALLMQVFRGDRSCPDDLEKLILQVIRNRLAKEPARVISLWIERARLAIHYQNINPYEFTSFDPDRIFKEMLADAEQARVHFIINFRTIEEQAGTDEERAQGKAKALQSILIRRLHLHHFELVDVEPTTRYVFCLPTPRSAEYFWLGLFNAITKNNPVGLPLSEAKAKERINFLNKEFLKVWVVPEIMCGCPLVVFNPQDGPSSYSFCFHTNDRVSIMKWDKDSISKWNMLVYTPFTLGSPKIGPKHLFAWDKANL